MPKRKREEEPRIARESGTKRKRDEDDEEIDKVKKTVDASVKRFKGRTTEDKRDRKEIQEMIAQQQHKRKLKTETDCDVEKKRVTPQEEVAKILGWDILEAQTDLDEYDIESFTPNARLIVVLGKVSRPA